jgi:hypothetical protein
MFDAVMVSEIGLNLIFGFCVLPTAPETSAEGQRHDGADRNDEH